MVETQRLHFRRTGGAEVLPGPGEIRYIKDHLRTPLAATSVEQQQQFHDYAEVAGRAIVMSEGSSISVYTASDPTYVVQVMKVLGYDRELKD